MTSVAEDQPSEMARPEIPEFERIDFRGSYEDLWARADPETLRRLGEKDVYRQAFERLDDPVVRRLVDAAMADTRDWIVGIEEDERYSAELARPTEESEFYFPIIRNSHDVDVLVRDVATRQLGLLPTVVALIDEARPQLDTEPALDRACQQMQKMPLHRLADIRRYGYFAARKLDSGHNPLAWQMGAALSDGALAIAARSLVEPEMTSDVERALRDIGMTQTFFNFALSHKSSGGGTAGTERAYLRFRKRERDAPQDGDTWLFDVSTNTMDPEGDHEWQDEHGLTPDYFVHPGAFRVFASANRITLSYVPEIDTAREPYVIEVSKGDKSWRYRDMRISLDVDPDAPHGMSVDYGRDERSPKDPALTRRSPDLIGKVLAQRALESGQTTHFTSRFEAGSGDGYPELRARLTQRLDRWLPAPGK